MSNKKDESIVTDDLKHHWKTREGKIGGGGNLTESHEPHNVPVFF